MFSLPETATLLPQKRMMANGRMLYIITSDSTDLVKLDFLYEAGSAYQPQMLCAAAACKLHMLSGGGHTAAQLSEFLDYRGVIVETSPDVLQSTVTVYFLRRYAGELLPLLLEVMECADFPEEEFRVYCGKRRQELLSAERKTNEVARRLFYQELFGVEHPLGRYAVADDVDRLQLDVVKDFYRRRFVGGEMSLVLSGSVDEKLVELVESCFGMKKCGVVENTRLAGLSGGIYEMVERQLRGTKAIGVIDGAVQSTVRIGRVLPLQWKDMNYARFMLLTTILGGYFGSRLMQNLREERGLTYGVYARTQIYRGCIVFYATADVADDRVEEAESEMVKEIGRLMEEEIGEEELELAKRVIAGDFLRSVDGVFERSARLCDMLGSGIDETFTDNLRSVLENVTPAEIQSVAQKMMNPQEMLICSCGGGRRG